MNEKDDILGRRPSGDQPFRIPEAYFESLEDRVMARIAAEEQADVRKKSPVWAVLRPALTLAAMFALVFGMGYGVLSLTHTLDRGTGTTEVSGYATVEEEMINPVSLINYYQTDPEEDTELDEETIINYLATELSYSDLAEIYAQAY
jgi:hypothetical protein